MVVKNNYFWKDEEKKIDFIANGDIVKVERVLVNRRGTWPQICRC